MGSEEWQVGSPPCLFHCEFAGEAGEYEVWDLKKRWEWTKEGFLCFLVFGRFSFYTHLLVIRSKSHRRIRAPLGFRPWSVWGRRNNPLSRNGNGSRERMQSGSFDKEMGKGFGMRTFGLGIGEDFSMASGCLYKACVLELGQ